MPVLIGKDQQPGAGYDPELKPSVPTQPEFDIGLELGQFMRGVLNYFGGYAGREGAYGISDSEWATMSTAAGVAGANKQDPSMQDYVAAFMLNQLYTKYRNWNLVAVAWQHGTGTADSIVIQTRKDPRDITTQDIQTIAPDAFKFSSAVMADAVKLGMKGYEHGMDTMPPITQQPRTVITGTAHAQPPDPFAATFAQLQEEALNEETRRQPSGAEMLFAQLETLSGVVSGGEGRVDWRSDFGEEVKSGGSVQELPDLERPGEQDAAR